VRVVSTPVRSSTVSEHLSATASASERGACDDVTVDVLVVGAGPSGLGTAAFFAAAQRVRNSSARLVVLEAAAEPGGYCRTVKQGGFVFDYAGHFFHFRDPSLRALLMGRLPPDALCTVTRRARVIDVDGCEVDYPYQAHIGGLPQPAFIACLRDLWSAEQQRLHAGSSSTLPVPTSFKAFLYERLGRTMCERFLQPYNEKLYATDLDTLDADCMGRFFPVVQFADVMAALDPAASTSHGYNSTFTYPRGGAVTYIDALRADLRDDDLWLNEPVLAIDPVAHVATTTKRRVHYRQLVTSAPLPKTLAMCGFDVDTTAFTANRVLVFNFGFDKKARADAHWVYVARADVPFYRVGFYDVIVDGPRAALYVEIGLPQAGHIDITALREHTLMGLRTLGFISDHVVVSEHHVVMDPAYVHLTPHSLRTTDEALATLRTHDIHSIGRYGAWTYCSIEDNLLAARALVDDVLVPAVLEEPP
jgi:protoporphyrinogen oxidase